MPLWRKAQIIYHQKLPLASRISPFDNYIISSIRYWIALKSAFHMTNVYRTANDKVLVAILYMMSFFARSNEQIFSCKITFCFINLIYKLSIYWFKCYFIIYKYVDFVSYNLTDNLYLSNQNMLLGPVQIALPRTEGRFLWLE